MYINITEDLVRIAMGKSGASHAANDVLNKLNDAVKYGFHYVRAKRNTLDLIQKANKWPYLELLSRYLTIKPPFKWRAEFVTGPDSRDDVEKVCNISITKQDRDYSFIFSKTKLLTENSTDGVIYGFLLEYYKTKCCLSNDNSYECISGGGGTIGEEFNKYCTLFNSFCLCLVDSDMHYKNAPLGQTAIGVDRVHKSKYPGGFGHIIDALEIENLLPQQLYKQYCEKYLIHEINRYKQIKAVESKDEEYIKYIDLKLGISLYNLLNLKKDDNSIEVVRSVIPDIEKKIELDKRSITDEVLQKQHKYILGYGEGILKTLQKKLQENGLSLLDCEWSSMTSFQRNEFEVIGELINDWTCKSEKIC